MAKVVFWRLSSTSNVTGSVIVVLHLRQVIRLIHILNDLVVRLILWVVLNDHYDVVDVIRLVLTSS